MKCDLCENEATVRELTKKNGVRFERHLCERCAREQGITVQSQTPLEEILKHFVVAAAPATAAPESAKPKAAPGVSVCPSCRLSFTDFKQSGNLGCAACYKTFEVQLSTLLERAHEGACLHLGKSPRRHATAPKPGAADTEPSGPSHEERVQKIQTLRRQLEDAVKGEQYERAAKLRDELKRHGGGGQSAA